MSFCRAPRCPALCRVQPVVSFRYHCLCHPCCPGGRCLPSDLVRAYLGAPHLRHGIASSQPQLLWSSDHSQGLSRALDVPRTVRGTGSLITLTCTQPPRPQGHPPRSPLSLTPAQPPTPTAAHPALRGLPLLPLLLPVPAASRAPSMPCGQPHGARLGSLKPQPALTPTAKSSQRPINMLIPVAG